MKTLRSKSFASLAASLLLVAAAPGCNSDRLPVPGPKAVDAKLIASQTVLSDEILWALGPSVRERTIAVSSMADDRRYSAVADQWPKDVPRVGGTAEALLATGPSLVIVASFTAAETREMLGRAKIETLVLSRFDGFEDFRHNVTSIGASAEAPEQAKKIVAGFDARLTKIEAARSSGRPTVMSLNDGNVAGSTTCFDDVSKAAGFENLASTRGIKGHSRVGLEQVVAWNPEFIVIPCGESGCEAATGQFSAQPGVAEMTAVRNAQIVAIDSAILYSTGATMLDAAEILQAKKADAKAKALEEASEGAESP